MKRPRISNKNQPDEQLLPWEANGPVQFMLRLCSHADNPNLQRKLINAAFDAKPTWGNLNEIQTRNIWGDIWLAIDDAIRERFKILSTERMSKSYGQNMEYAYLQLSVIRLVNGFGKTTATERKRSISSKICSLHPRNPDRPRAQAHGATLPEARHDL